MATPTVSLLDVLLPYECHSIIFAHLPRSSLKSLRQTCKAVDALVVSPASHLFSRVYLSIFREDLVVLHKMVDHPTISRCVRELIWDTTRGTAMVVNLEDGSEARPAVAVAEGTDEAPAVQDQFRGQSLARIVAGGLDFKALLCALVRLPFLRGVVMVDLMMERLVDWSQSPHAHLPYASPELRRLIVRQGQQSALGWARENYLPKRAAGETVLEDVSRVAKAFMTQIEMEMDAEGVEAGSMGTGVEQSEVMDDAGSLAMLIVALQQTGAHLDSITCGLDQALFDKCLHRQRNPHWLRMVPCLPLSWFETRTVLTEGFTHTLLRPLRRLSLGLITSKNDKTERALELQAAANNNFLTALKAAENLEVLELHGAAPAVWTCDTNTALPPMVLQLGSSIPRGRLRKLALGNFSLNRRELEKAILPGCFDMGVRTLHLQGCTIHREARKPMDVLEYCQYLVSKDITEPVPEPNEDEIEMQQKQPNPTPWPFDSDSDSDSNDSKDHLALFPTDVPFTEIAFGFDIDDSDSEHATNGLCDLSDDDTYTPWTNDKRIPASTLAGCTDPWQMYLEEYYDEAVGAYDEEYLADTEDLGDVADELPAPRLDARLAGKVVGLSGADVEFVFGEKDWRSKEEGEGERNGVLRVLIDSLLVCPFYH